MSVSFGLCQCPSENPRFTVKKKAEPKSDQKKKKKEKGLRRAMDGEGMTKIRDGEWRTKGQRGKGHTEVPFQFVLYYSLQMTDLGAESRNKVPHDHN